MKVLITTSGLGNRLGNITKFTNKSLVRLGNVAAITKIINQYPADTEFVVTLGYYGDHVEQYLQLAHSDKNIKFVKVDRYEGTGSSLLYSMYCAKNQLQSPFIFHVCDSIIDDNINFGDGNVCVAARNDDNSQYRTIRVENNKIVDIEEKGSLTNKITHIGVIQIKDYELFWDITEKLLMDFPNDTSLSDCHVIKIMIASDVEFKLNFTNMWYDIGNSKSLEIAKNVFEAKDSFKILDKEEENIFIFDKFVIKFFNDKNIVTNRVKRVEHLCGYGPKLLDYTDNYYKYEFVNGELASHSLDVDLFYNLLVELKENYWSVIDTNKTFYDKTYKFYFDKTKERVNLFHKQNNRKYKSLKINGKHIENFDTLFGKISADLLCTNVMTRFHGDFILDNLIIKDNKFKFLDWRQDFCGSVEGGDVYYDLAKMNHSLHFDHSLVVNNNFKVEDVDGNVQIELICKLSSVLKKQKFEQFLTENGFNLKKVNILTSIIWLNMSPLHIYPLNIFLYYLGMYTLQLNIDKK